MKELYHLFTQLFAHSRGDGRRKGCMVNKAKRREFTKGTEIFFLEFETLCLMMVLVFRVVVCFVLSLMCMMSAV